MAEKKKTKASGKSGKVSVNQKRVSAKKKEMKKDKEKSAQSFTAQIAPYILGVVAIFLGVCMYAGDNAGVIGGLIHDLFVGLAGGVAYALPVIVLIPAVRYSRDNEDGVFGR